MINYKTKEGCIMKITELSFDIQMKKIEEIVTELLLIKDFRDKLWDENQSDDIIFFFDKKMEMSHIKNIKIKQAIVYHLIVNYPIQKYLEKLENKKNKNNFMKNIEKLNTHVGY